MRRRAVIAALLAAGAATRLARHAIAQQRIPLIGILRLPPRPDLAIDGFVEGLRELGYREGTNLAFLEKRAEGDVSRLPALAAALAAAGVDAIVTGGESAIQAAKDAAPTVPIVMGASNDPVASGFAASLARPGGTITGMTIFARELSAKRLEVFKEAVPRLGDIGVLYEPAYPTWRSELHEVEAAARAVKVRVHPIAVPGPEALEAAFRAIADRGGQGVTALPDPFFTGQRQRLAELARRHGFASVFYWREFAEAGALMSYGPNLTALYRRAAGHVDKILKGARPGELPIEQPTNFELVINMATARTLGIEIPPSILARADEVIE